MADNTDDGFDAMYDRASEAGRALLEEGVLASTARYEPSDETLRVGLRNGVAVVIPVALIETLAEATEDQRTAIEIPGVGYGLHWPELDLDLSVPGLLAGVFGTKAWMDRQRAARAGATSSPAKAAAARANGAKGGRPRKSVR